MSILGSCVNSEAYKHRTEIVKVKEMVRRVMEETLSSDNFEGIKRKLGIVLKEALRVIKRDEDILNELPGYKNGAEKQQPVGGDEQSGTFLEEKLIISILHKDQCVAVPLIGSFEPTLICEASSHNSPVVGPKENCAKEARQLHGPSQSGLHVHPILDAPTSSKDLGLVELACSGLECPPGFENWIGEVRPHHVGISHCRTLDNCGVSNAWVDRIEDDQGIGYSHGLFSNSTKMVPQTPLLEPTSLLYKDDDKK